MRFQEDPNGTLSPGDVEVVSEFARPPEAAFGAGTKTHRISTTRRLGQMTTHREDQAATARREMPSGTVATEPSGHARIVYKDDRGTHTFLVTKDEIVIGRQAPDVWADLSIDTSLDVSREHARLQRTPEGVFRIKDLSKLGTTVNGVPLPRSLEAADGGVKDLDRWERAAGQGAHRPRRGDLSRLREARRRMTALYFARLAFVLVLVVLAAALLALAARERK